MKRARKFTLIIERHEQGYCVATVPALPGCHTQGKNLDTLMQRVREVVELCLERRPPPGASVGTCGHPANLSMTRLPRLKEKERIRLLTKYGFEVVRTRAATFFCGMRMGE